MKSFLMALAAMLAIMIVADLSLDALGPTTAEQASGAAVRLE